jgi:phage terminase large subunit GpA-like protein
LQKLGFSLNKEVGNWFLNSLKPDPVLTVSQWADKHRYLTTKTSSEPGVWRTDRTPYLKEIMDVLSITHPAQKIVFKKASQIGGTESGYNWLGYVIDHAPGPFMLVMPTVDTARKVSRQRIEPLIEASRKLKDKVRAQKSRDSSNTMLMKDFPGGTLVIAGANSAAGLKSMPAKFLMLDEVDEYPLDVEGQGDPISLVLARSRTFSRRKAFLASTPTIDGISKIDDEFEISDQRFYFVPCPHCNHKQKLEFKNLQWEPLKPDTALYYCEGCGVGIEERFKTKMLKGGEWIAQAESKIVGFHLSSLYSPVGWFSWADVATAYDEAKNDFEKYRKTEKMKAFTNTILGETYKEVGEAPEWKNLYLRREKYKQGSIPSNKIKFLSCGVDVQKDRLELEIIGWGDKKENWSIDYIVLLGDTADDKVWNELDKVINKVYHFENDDSVGLPIRITAVDSGYNTQHVYNFCRKYPISRVVAIKGVDSLSVIIGHPRAVDVKSNGKTFRRGVKVFSLGVSLLKSELYGWLKMLQPVNEETPTGYSHFPEYDEEYFRQLTAEKLIIKKNRRGFAQTEWVKDRERNEALDTRIYARAAASLVGLDRQKSMDRETQLINNVAKENKSEQDEIETHKTEAPLNKKTVPRTRRKSEYW